MEIRSFQYSDYDKVLAFLLEMEAFYPDIESWWINRVFPSLGRNERAIFVVDVEGSIEGLFIGKRGTAAKICTLRLKEDICGQGVGKALLIGGLNDLIDLNTDSIRVTVNETFKDAIRFFKSMGFEQVAVEKNRYVKGVDEVVLFCSRKSYTSGLFRWRRSFFFPYEI